HCWQYRQFSGLHRVLFPTWPDKDGILRYKAKQGHGIHWIPVHSTYGKSVHCGVNQLKFIQSLQSLRKDKLNVTLGLKLLEEVLTTSGSPLGHFKPVHKHGEMQELTSLSLRSQGLIEGHKFPHTVGVSHRAA
ncbi:60S ribosomal protein L15, partial [Galemys pyrenaicus]